LGILFSFTGIMWKKPYNDKGRQGSYAMRWITSYHACVAVSRCKKPFEHGL